MELIMRKVKANEIDRVFEIEENAFPPEEAATKEKYEWRQKKLP